MYTVVYIEGCSRNVADIVSTVPRTVSTTAKTATITTTAKTATTTTATMKIIIATEISTTTITQTTPTTPVTPITSTDGHLGMAGHIDIAGAMGHETTRVKLVSTRMPGTRIIHPWRTRCPVPQGLVLAAEMEGQRC